MKTQANTALRVIIADDEENSCRSLKTMLEDYCEGVEVLAISFSVTGAAALIKTHQPDIVFIDIEMPGQNGFQIYNHFPDPDFNVVFITANEQYATKAFRHNALDYLLKPIDLNDLREAVRKANNEKKLTEINRQVHLLKENKPEPLQKLALPAKDGFEFVNPNEIIRCEAQGNYTMFFMVHNKKLLVSKTLKVFSDVLEELNFFRINRSHLINLRHIFKYNRQKNSSVEMTDGSVLPVSDAKRSDFLSRFEPL